MRASGIVAAQEDGSKAPPPRLDELCWPGVD